jgi:hypothetical protein
VEVQGLFKLRLSGLMLLLGPLLFQNDQEKRHVATPFMY